MKGLHIPFPCGWSPPVAQPGLPVTPHSLSPLERRPRAPTLDRRPSSVLLLTTDCTT